MTLPKVTITQLSNALGVQSPETRNVAVVACTTSGTAAVPAAYSRSAAMRSAYTSGPGVEMASRLIDTHGLTVVMVRAASATDGAMGTTDDSGVTGTATVTSKVAAKPIDAYEVLCEVTTGGALGTAGIVVRPSLDNGRTWLAPIALGTGLELAIPGTGVAFVLASSASTLVAGDTWSVATTAPMWSSTSIGAALDALGATATAWDGVVIVGDLTGALFDTIDAKIAGLATHGKYHWWLGHTRVPNAGEDDATYQAAMVTALGSKSSIYGCILSGAERFTSNVSGAVYTRSSLYSVAGQVANVSDEIDPAWIDLGALPGTDIRDANGNIIAHDEAENPGLDDARFSSLRTWDGYPGVYPTNVRVFSAPGSDFQFVQHRRVMNIALRVSRAYLVRQLSRPLRVNKKTGKILEADRRMLEDGLNAKLRGALLSKPKASDTYCVVAKDDDLLGGDPLTVDVRVTPLAYPKEIAASVGFVNPSLQKV